MRKKRTNISGTLKRILVNILINLRIRNKFLLSFSIFMLVPFLVIILTNYLIIDPLMLKNSLELERKTLAQYCSDINYRMGFFESVSRQVISDEKLNDVLNTKYTGYLDVSLAYITCINKLSSSITNSNSLLSMSIYTNNPTLICDNHYIKRLDDAFMQTQAYQKLVSEKAGTLAVFDGDGNISFYRIMNYDRTQYSTSILNFKLTSSVIREPGGTADGDVFIIDANQNHLAVSGKEENFSDVLPYVKDMDGSGMISKSLNNRDIILYTTTNLGWKVIKIIKPTIFFTEATRARNLVSLLLGISAVLLFVLIILISGRLTRRIDALIRKINTVKHGEYDRILPIEGMDEIGQASRAMDGLSTELKYLIETVYTSRLANTKLELENLQARINPHFLYNTLSGIDWYMQKDDVGTSRELLRSLALFYRSSLERGDDVVTVEDEIHHLRMYLNIELRLLENIFASIDIPEEMRGIRINRMTLQPIVENAIKYAIKSSDEPLHILVTGSVEENAALIRITDDGVGIPRKTAEEFNRSHVIPSRGTGVGLANVDARVRIRFGGEYGLSIGEKDAPGAEIVIRLPLDGLNSRPAEPACS